jgi:hypothetical protein
MHSKFSSFLKRSRSRFLRNSLKVFGICGACFVFEACYGTPQADYPESSLSKLDVSGSIKGQEDANSGPVEVLLTNGRYNDTMRTYTDAKSCFVFYDVKSSNEPYHILLRDQGKTIYSSDFQISQKELMQDRKELEIHLNH